MMKKYFFSLSIAALSMSFLSGALSAQTYKPKDPHSQNQINQEQNKNKNKKTNY
jgi:hypothetical protein